MEPNFIKEGRRYNEQERFLNLCSSNYYLPFTIIVIRSFNIKVLFNTREARVWYHSDASMKAISNFFAKVSNQYNICINFYYNSIK